MGASLLGCALEDKIADLSAKCDADGKNCEPLVLLQGGRPGRVVNCTTQQDLMHLAGENATSGQPSLMALQAGQSMARSIDGPLLALQGDDVVEYNNGIARGMKFRVNGTNVQSIDYDDANRLYIFERSNFVEVVDLNTLESLGKFAMPREYPTLASGTLMGSNKLYLLPEGPTPKLLQWSPQF